MGIYMDTFMIGTFMRVTSVYFALGSRDMPPTELSINTANHITGNQYQGMHNTN